MTSTPSPLPPPPPTEPDGFVSMQDSRLSVLRTPTYVGVILLAGHIQFTTTRLGIALVP